MGLWNGAVDTTVFGFVERVVKHSGRGASNGRTKGVEMTTPHRTTTALRATRQRCVHWQQRRSCLHSDQEHALSFPHIGGTAHLAAGRTMPPKYCNKKFVRNWRRVWRRGWLESSEEGHRLRKPKEVEAISGRESKAKN